MMRLMTGSVGFLARSQFRRRRRVLVFLAVFVGVISGISISLIAGSRRSCSVSSSTLDEGLTRILLDRLPWVREVRGDVDDSMSPEESEALGRGAYVPR